MVVILLKFEYFKLVFVFMLSVLFIFIDMDIVGDIFYDGFIGVVFEDVFFVVYIMIGMFFGWDESVFVI